MRSLLSLSSSLLVSIFPSIFLLQTTVNVAGANANTNTTLVCYNSCTSTLGQYIYMNVTRMHNLTATSNCKPSCMGASCFTMYSHVFSTPIYGCSERANLLYAGCLKENDTSVVCYCLSNNCNMPLTKLIAEGWTFPELVLTLPLDQLLKNNTTNMNNSTAKPVVDPQPKTAAANVTASSINGTTNGATATVKSIKMIDERNASDGTANNSAAANVTINPSDNGQQQQQVYVDGTVNLRALIWPLLNPEPFDDNYIDGSANNNGTMPATSNENITFPLVIVKPPDPLYEDERNNRTKGKNNSGTGKQQTNANANRDHMIEN